MRNELPRGWAQTTIADICEINPPLGKSVAKNADVSFVPMAAVSEISGSIESPQIRKFAAVAKGYTQFRNDDVIFAKITPCMENGKSAIAYGLTNGVACGSTEFFVLRSNGSILPELLHRFLRQQTYREAAARTMNSAVGQARVPKSFITGTSFALPPLPEQRRIVARLEKLDGRSRRVRTALDTIPPLLAHARQSLLAAACSGRLTADWRKRNPHCDSASVRLSDLATARRRLRTKGDHEKKYDEPSDPAKANLPTIPKTWSWISLDSALISLRNGIAIKPDADFGLPILRISALRPLALNTEDRRFLHRDSAAYDDYTLAENDLLFTRYNGNAELVGVCACVPRLKERLVYPDKLIRARVVPTSLNPHFVAAVANCGASRDFIASCGKTAAGQVGISGTDLKRTPIPFPPLAEQHEIVRRVERALARLDAIGEAHAVAIADLDRFDQSLLAKAFRGDLVKQNPADEPADKSLAKSKCHLPKSDDDRTSTM